MTECAVRRCPIPSIGFAAARADYGLAYHSWAAAFLATTENRSWLPKQNGETAGPPGREKQCGGQPREGPPAAHREK
jgi:hypothetical protein